MRPTVRDDMDKLTQQRNWFLYSEKWNKETVGDFVVRFEPVTPDPELIAVYWASPYRGFNRVFAIIRGGKGNEANKA